MYLSGNINSNYFSSSKNINVKIILRLYTIVAAKYCIIIMFDDWRVGRSYQTFFKHVLFSYKMQSVILNSKH